MSELLERVNYLQGLVEGAGLPDDARQGQLLQGILEALAGAGRRLDELAEAQADIEDYVCELDEELAELRLALGLDGAEDWTADTEAEELAVEFSCPGCGLALTLAPASVDEEAEADEEAGVDEEDEAGDAPEPARAC